MQNPPMPLSGMSASAVPVGGAPMAPTQPNGPRDPNLLDADPTVTLNTFIYDYFIQNNQPRMARSMIDCGTKLYLKSSPRPSPNSRNVNGMDAMDPDSKDDLPAISLPNTQIAEGAFLMDWWCQFWELWRAARVKGNPTSAAHQYLTHTRNAAAQGRAAIANALGQYRPVNMNMMQPTGLPNGVGPNDLKRAAMTNRAPVNANQMANMNHLKNQAMMSAQMQRDGSGVDLNGQRPHSPSSTENAPSPSKRPRLDSTAFNGQPMGARTQGIPPQAMGASAVGPGGQMMLGINGANGPGGHFNDFGQQGPHPKIEGVNSGAQGSPMNSQALEGSNDMFASNAQAAAGSGGNQSTPTHALQDYQLQLMLLEQQNKKRLLMAKQEQDSISQGPHGPSAPGAAHVFAPAMSPQGSRTGPSPNPADQIKRGTPKLGHQGLPGSPMGADGLQPNRNSPAPNFEHQMQPPPSHFYQGMPGNPMMRPPGSHPGNFANHMGPAQIEALRNGQVPNGAWRGGPPTMMPGQVPQPPGPANATQHRNPMPPPPAPPAGDQPGRASEPSPSQQSAAPPTPSQSTKPALRKKDNKDTKKKPAKKNAAATGTTPAGEAEPPQTPAPSTPITPMHPKSFNPPPNGQAQPQPPPPAPSVSVAAPAPQVPPPMDNNPPFGNLGEEPNFDLAFMEDQHSVLDNFDFEQFLHPDGDNGLTGFGPDFFQDGMDTNSGEV